MSTTKFKNLIPLLNRVLIQKSEAVKKSKSGIILSTKDATGHVGKVVAVGPGFINDKGVHTPVNVKVGSTVLLPDFSGVKVELADGEYYVFRDSELVGVLEGPTEKD